MIFDTPSQLDSPREKYPKLISNLGIPLLPVIYGEVGQWGPHSTHCFSILFAVTLAISRSKFKNMGGIQLPMNHRIIKQSLPLHLTSPCNAKCQLLQEPCHCVDHAYLPIPSYSPACLLFTRGACCPIFADYWCSDFQFVRPMHHAGATMFLQ